MADTEDSAPRRKKTPTEILAEKTAMAKANLEAAGKAAETRLRKSRLLARRTRRHQAGHED